MNIKETFNALLSGECITRPDWHEIYVKYDKDKNNIRIYNNKELIKVKRSIRFNEDSIELGHINYKENKILTLQIVDDDKNEIYKESGKKIDKKELGYMKYKIIEYTENIELDCNNCKIKHECLNYNWDICDNKYIIDLSPKNVLKLYNSIINFNEKKYKNEEKYKAGDIVVLRGHIGELYIISRVGFSNFKLINLSNGDYWNDTHYRTVEDLLEGENDYIINIVPNKNIRLEKVK